MEGKFDLKLLENLASLSFPLSKANSLKIIINTISDIVCNVDILIPGNRRIFFYILNLNISNQSSRLGFVETSTSNEEYRGSNLVFLKTLHFPVAISDFGFSNENLLAFGKDNICFVKLKDHFPYKLQQNDEPMEISVEEKFELNDFESVVKMHKLQRHHYQNIYISQIQDFFDGGFVVCYKNNETQMWCIALVIENPSTRKDNCESTFIPLLDFPFSYTKNITTNFNEPQIIFCDSNHIFWNKVFTLEQKLYSNCVFIIGHPEGKILYSLCSWSKQTKELNLTTPLEEVCDINQPILSTCFVESLGKIEGSGALIILGQKGNLELITPNQICKDSIIIKKGLFWLTSLELTTPVQNYIVLSDCIIHSSNGDIWITKFISDNSVVKHKNKYLKSLTQATDFSEVVKMSLVNKSKGIFLMVTKSGNLYLMQYCSETNATTVKKSLPSLMNGILQQSLSMKKILSIKHSQSKFFAAVSTFASLKFNVSEGPKFSLNCEMKEIEGNTKKLFVDLDFQNIDQFNLDPEFWFITALIYNPYETNAAVISKTKPLSLGSTLCIEILESNICSLHGSCFPLYLEVGVILDLPNNLKDMDCFKLVSKILPLYLRVHTSILTELYLLKNKPKNLKCHKFTSDAKTNTILQKIIDYNIKNSLCKIVKNDIRNFTEYTLCLSDSIVKDLFGPSDKESNIEHRILQLLSSKSSVQLTTEGSILIQNQPLSLTVFQKNNIAYIKISAATSLLLGLKLAISELLLNDKNKCTTLETNCVGIPAKLLRKCEDLSKELIKMYGQNVNDPNFLDEAFQVYCSLRKEISEKLPQ